MNFSKFPSKTYDLNLENDQLVITVDRQGNVLEVKQWCNIRREYRTRTDLFRDHEHKWTAEILEELDLVLAKEEVQRKLDAQKYHVASEDPQ